MRSAKCLFTHRSGAEFSPCATDLWPWGCWTGPPDWFCCPQILSMVNINELKISSLQTDLLFKLELEFAAFERPAKCRGECVSWEPHLSQGACCKIKEKRLNITLRFLLRPARYRDRVNWSWAGYALSSFIPGKFWFLNENRWIWADRRWLGSWAVIYKRRNQV